MLAVLTGGCASIPDDVGSTPVAVRSVELASTPFFPQERFQCGPAALATVLEASGIDVSLDALVERVYLPGRKGSLTIELMTAMREHGRLAYPLAGTIDEVLAELDAGRPVLVFQNLGVAWLPKWHYAVVVGYDAEADRIVLRSGTERRRLTPRRVFLRTWQRGDFWSAVALEPGQLPARPDPARYFRAAAGLETAGRRKEARAAWRAALGQWPGSAVPPFALGNIALAEGRHDAAIGWYRQALRLDPGYWTASNNLAHALAAAGRAEAAQRTLREALELVADDEAAREVLLSSQQELGADRPPH
ncbi:MAG: PA2778 family cysteine peptidase [Woeseiaceae bacterium]|nr:PA2778 family cysteine peptidase [Woeseiaceae bacterium]